MLTGGCHCGYLRYEADGVPFDAALCHCSICRRTTGAPAVAWFSVPASGFRLTAGEPTRYASTSRATRGFCPRCGAQLFFESQDEASMDISTASLDDPHAAAPADHIWAEDRLAWMQGLDDLPDFPRSHREGRA